MDIGIVLLLGLSLGVVFFIIQRAESRRRLFVAVIMLVVLELVRRYTWYRDVHAEALTALFFALLINFIFWLFIGRYNPVANSDDIRVLGLDD